MEYHSKNSLQVVQKVVEDHRSRMEMNKNIRYVSICLLFVTMFFTLNHLTDVIGLSGRSVTQIVKTSDNYFRFRIKGKSALDKASELFKTRYAGVGDVLQRTLVSNLVSVYGTCHHGNDNTKLTEKPIKYVNFSKKYSLNKELAKTPLSERDAKLFCNNKIVSYGNRIAILHDVVMFPKERSDHGVSGGEEVIKVFNQLVSKEHYQYKNGFLKIKCSKDSTKLGPFENDNKWLKSIKYEYSDIKSDDIKKVGHYVIAIERHDYANVHTNNWAREMLNTLLMMIEFNIQPDKMSVLFLDAHPFSARDIAWEEIFGPIQRIGHLENPISFENLISVFKESDTPVYNYHHRIIAKTEEYRTFVLSKHGLNSEAAKLSCSMVKITIIIGRNTVYRPQKIFNQAELIEGLMKAFPNTCVQVMMTQTLPFHLQLEILSQTDLLIGMHGADMSHTLFLPQHSAILELFTKGLKAGRLWFESYQQIARWRGLHYDTWENVDASAESRYDYTILPVGIVVQKAKNLIDILCKS